MTIMAAAFFTWSELVLLGQLVSMCIFCLKKGAVLKLAQLIFVACGLFAHLLTSCIQKLLTLPTFLFMDIAKLD